LGGIESIYIEQRVKTTEFVAFMPHGWRKIIDLQVDKVYDLFKEAVKSYGVIDDIGAKPWLPSSDIKKPSYPLYSTIPS
jgi:hypothetical protein